MAKRSLVSRHAPLESPRVTGMQISSALEIAGDDVELPQTHAIVRAVPISQVGNSISVPGDRDWKYANIMSQNIKNIHKMNKPPDDIALHCKDGSTMITLYITWDMSWSDILDLLKQKFHRACVFSYYDRTSRTEFLINSEDDFDFFCSKIEKFGEATVHIKNATFMPSDFVTDQFLVPSQPLEDESSHSNTSELEIGEVEFEDMPTLDRISWFSRFSDCPVPIVYIILFGGSGFLVSILAVVLGFLFNYNNVAAIAVALPCNIFWLSFWIKEVACKMTKKCLNYNVATVGFRQPEVIEEIQILGEPPPASIFNAFQTVEERFPGARWIKPVEFLS
eukprot:192725-Hanusia_phi.AAC.1